MRYATLCSGIEGFGAGFDAAGMECVFQCEQDENCRKLLSEKWPHVSRTDDVNDERTATELVRLRPDLLAFGFPCQDLSVAGRRAGLAGERSGLFFRCAELARACAARWLVIENVPGLLSSNGGRDMGTVLGVLAELGYGTAYRVLDAQWFGVAQRRRRVFIVGCLGDWRRAAEVLFERESLPWDSPPSREAGTRVAASLTRGSAGGRGVNQPGRRCEDDVNIVNCLDRHMGAGGPDDNAAQAGHLVHCKPIADPITAGYAKGAGVNDGKKGSPQNLLAYGGNNTRGPIEGACLNAKASASGRQDFESETLIAHTLRAEGHDASEDGTGMAVRRLTPLERERLMGLPDNWTAGFSDSVRYRMLGNSIVAPVASWIARRILATGG